MAVNANNNQDLTWPIVATVAGVAAAFGAVSAPSLSEEAVKAICSIIGLAVGGYGATHLAKAAKEGLEDRVNRLIFPHPVKTALSTALLASVGAGIGSVFGPSFVGTALKTAGLCSWLYSSIPTMVGAAIGAGIGLYSYSEQIPLQGQPQGQARALPGLVGNPQPAAPPQQVPVGIDWMGPGNAFHVPFNRRNNRFNSVVDAVNALNRDDLANNIQPNMDANLLIALICKLGEDPALRRTLIGTYRRGANGAFWDGGMSHQQLTGYMHPGIDLPAALINAKRQYRVLVETGQRVN